MLRRFFLPALAASVVTLRTLDIGAAVVARASVDQRGDAVLIGNVLAHNCAGSVPDPIVGAVGECGDDVGDSGADVFWGLDPEGDETALASVDVEQASSVALLALPPRAVVTRARLYWSAQAGDADAGVATLSRDGVFSAGVSADRTARLLADDDEFYQSTADVTALVRARGAGAYRVSGVDIAELIDRDSEVSYAAWWMVVFYELSTDPLRNLTLFDGFELVSDGDAVNVSLSGFAVPARGFDAKLAVVAFEGDAAVDGDSLRFGPTLPLTGADELLDSDNFFDGSRLALDGDASSVPGDLPQLSGEPGSASGLDLDLVEVTDRVRPGQTTAQIQVRTDDDFFLLAGFVTSISTFRPDLTSSVKTVRDVNGAPLRPGDELEYTISIANTGSDSATGVSLLDALPRAVTFVPGSLQIAAGAGAGPLSDGADADRGEIERNASGETVAVRLGTGGTGVLGGRLDVGASSVVIYRVRVATGASGVIENQAEVSAVGLLGGELSVTPTDGNSGAPGAPPTLVSVDGCALDLDCSEATPFCDPSVSPRRCVACLLDAHCGGLTPDCSAARRCECVGSGLEERCDGADDNCNGAIDEGFLDVPCLISVGSCAVAGTPVCETPTTTRCSGVPPTPGVEACLNGVDDDCDGTTDLGDSDCADADADGLPDPVELLIGTDPADPDSDGDGVRDGFEPEFDRDSDVDGLINALDADSDNDALRDGTELGFPCAESHIEQETCVPDADEGATLTSPLVADTDGGGVNDGSEDFDLDGVRDDGETDPQAGQAADDRSLSDRDNDGASDGLERFLGADADDADTDDDGLPDGIEPNPSLDEDGDTLLSLLDADSDADGLFDGTETGHACDDPATAPPPDWPPVLYACQPDVDPTTTTSPLVADSDRGGASDAREDLNQNGRVDAAETDPNRPGDDGSVAPCSDDAECSALGALRVCGEGSCVQGCRDGAPEGCPSAFVCVPLTAELGRCVSEADGVAPGDAGAPGSGDAGADTGGLPDEGPGNGSSPRPRDRLKTGAALGGGACTCRAAGSTGQRGGLWFLLGAAAWLLRRRLSLEPRARR